MTPLRIFNKYIQDRTDIQSLVADYNEPEEIELGIILENGMLAVEQISPNISTTDAGFLICQNAVIARTGILNYSTQEINVKPSIDGKVHAIRTAEEVFRPESIASFEGAPVTIEHPPTGKVEADTWKRFSVGTVMNVHQDGNLLLADLIIHDQNAINTIQNKGIKFLSCGYSSRLIDNEDGSVTQTNIKGNHVAITDAPRSGEVCQITDSENSNKNPINKLNSKEIKMTSKSKMQKSFFSWLFNDSDKDEEKEIEDTDSEDDLKDSAEHEAAEDTIYADLIKRIAALEAMNKTEEDKVTDSEEDKVTDSEDEDLEDEDADGEYVSNDSLKSILSKAEILIPGIELKEASPIGLKRQSLAQAILTDSTVKSLVGNSVKELTPKEVDIIFESAVKIKSIQNNTIIKPTVLTDSKTVDIFAAMKANFNKSNSK